jgi:hypothetical protein
MIAIAVPLANLAVDSTVTLGVSGDPTMGNLVVGTKGSRLVGVRKYSTSSNLGSTRIRFVVVDRMMSSSDDERR